MSVNRLAEPRQPLIGRRDGSKQKTGAKAGSADDHCA